MIRALARHAAPAALTALSVAACSKDQPSPPPLSSTQAESVLKSLAASVSALAPRMSAADLITPPLAAPASAQVGAEGVKWQLLKVGDGSPISDDDSIRAEL